MFFAFFHCVDICTNGTKAVVSKTSGTLGQIKSEHYAVFLVIVFFFCHALKKNFNLMHLMKKFLKKSFFKSNLGSRTYYFNVV